MARPWWSAGGTIQRLRDQIRSTRKSLSRFLRPTSFSTPPDAEAAAVRAVRNLAFFRFHYAVLLWISLLLTLAPHRRPTLFFLMAMSKVGAFYALLLRAFPSSRLLHRFLDRRLVVSLVGIVVVVQIVLTDAVGHLLTALGIGVPIVVLHAIFRVRDDLVGDEEGGDGGVLPEKKADKDVEASP